MTRTRYQYVGAEGARAGLPMEPFGDELFPAEHLASYLERGLIVAVETSEDTTNGLDGTWETVTLGAAPSKGRKTR